MDSACTHLLILQSTEPHAANGVQIDICECVNVGWSVKPFGVVNKTRKALYNRSLISHSVCPLLSPPHLSSALEFHPLRPQLYSTIHLLFLLPWLVVTLCCETKQTSRISLFLCGTFPFSFVMAFLLSVVF